MDLIEAFKSYLTSRRDSDYEVSGFTSLNLKAISSLPQHTGTHGWSSLGGQYIAPYSYPNTKIDFSSDVGDLRTSTLVMAAIQWVATSMADARLRVIAYDSDRKETEIQNHPAAMMWERPNPFYSNQTLLCGFALSWITASRAYFIKTKARAGNPLWLWYEPHWTIRPRWDQGGNDFISYYEIYRNGRWIRVETEDVIFIANGVDPETRLGMINPNTALLREYWTDNQAAQFMAQMFKKGLVPPVVIGMPGFTGDLKEFQAGLLRKMSGDTAGEPMLTKGDVRVEKLGFDYSKMGFKEIRQIPEERFCASMGISPHSLLFGAAAQTSTYSNVRQYLAHDYRSYIVRLHKMLASELNVQLLPDFGETEDRSVSWDYSQTALMQPDKEVEAKLSALLYEKGVIKRNEAREINQYKSEPEDEVYIHEVGQSVGDQILADMERRTPPMSDDEDDSDMPPMDEKPNGKTQAFV